MDERVEAPLWLAEHVAAFRASGAAAAVPRLAATVVLLRPCAGGFELYLQRRSATMKFAPGMYAFPGGSVDAADHDDPAGPPSEFDDAPMPPLGLEAQLARTVLRAAVREVAEETGVRLHPGTLAPWARWVTPEFEPRRFDTFFFVAPLPPGGSPHCAAGESDHAIWGTPGAASELPMLPPTRHTVAELAGYADVEAVLAGASGRDLSVPVTPILEVDSDGVWMRIHRG